MRSSRLPINPAVRQPGGVCLGRRLSSPHRAEYLGGLPPPSGTTGLYHVAILYPTRRSLADALGRLIAAEIPLDGASDHGVSEALYLRDPDDNGVELYWDRPTEAWPRTPEGKLAMFTRRLDLNGLLKEIEAKTNAPRAFGVPRLTNQVVSLQ